VSAIAVIERGLNGDNHVVVFEFKTSSIVWKAGSTSCVKVLDSGAYNNPKIF
jgi:hypothetical protein